MPIETSLHDALDVQKICQELGTVAQRFSIALRQRCESTNTDLLAMAEEGACSGTVLLCEQQTAGRGRRGRTWVAPAGGGLTFSVLWQLPKVPLGLSLAVGVAVARALEAVGAQDIQLKWPNDIVWQRRKLGGILIELLSARKGMVVIGIGLNVTLSVDDMAKIDAPVVDLATIMPIVPDRNVLMAKILRALYEVLACFEREGFAALKAEWSLRHAYANAWVSISRENAPLLHGRCIGVEEDGTLLLDTASGLERILSGEVSLRAL